MLETLKWMQCLMLRLEALRSVVMEGAPLTVILSFFSGRGKVWSARERRFQNHDVFLMALG